MLCLDYSRAKKHDHCHTVAEFYPALIPRYCLESPQSTKDFSAFTKSSENHVVDCKAQLKYLNQPTVCILFIQHNGPLGYSAHREILNTQIMNMTDCNSPFKQFTVSGTQGDFKNSRFLHTYLFCTIRNLTEIVVYEKHEHFHNYASRRKKKKTNFKMYQMSTSYQFCPLQPYQEVLCILPDCITRTQSLQSCFYISGLYKFCEWEQSSSPSYSNGLVKIRLEQLQSSCDDLQQILLSLIFQHKENKNLHIGQFFPTSYIN